MKMHVTGIVQIDRVRSYSSKTAEENEENIKLDAGVYAAFSAEGGCTLSLSRPHVSSP